MSTAPLIRWRTTARIGYYGRGSRSPLPKTIRIKWQKPVNVYEGDFNFSLVPTTLFPLMKKHAYQVTVLAAGITLSRYTEFTTVARSASQAERAVMRQVRKITKERARVSSVREVDGEFVG